MEPQNDLIKKLKPILAFIAPQTLQIGTRKLELWNALTTTVDILIEPKLPSN